MAHGHSVDSSSLGMKLIQGARRRALQAGSTWRRRNRVSIVCHRFCTSRYATAHMLLQGTADADFVVLHWSAVGQCISQALPLPLLLAAVRALIAGACNLDMHNLSCYCCCCCNKLCVRTSCTVAWNSGACMLCSSCHHTLSGDSRSRSTLFTALLI